MNIIESKLQFKGELEKLINENVYFLIIHHIAKEFATIEDIHMWHLEAGYLGCGYNEYIKKDGTVYIGRGNHHGAQCFGHNSDGYGIALEGDFNIETAISNEQYASVIERLKFHKLVFRNIKSIGGHNIFTPTDCPGKYLNVRNIVNDAYKEDKKYHWGMKHLVSLRKKGYKIHDERFDDYITRAEVFAIEDQRRD